MHRFGSSCWPICDEKLAVTPICWGGVATFDWRTGTHGASRGIWGQKYASRSGLVEWTINLAGDVGDDAGTDDRRSETLLHESTTFSHKERFGVGSGKQNIHQLRLSR